MSTRNSIGLAAAIVALAFAGAFGLHPYHDDWVTADAATQAIRSSHIWPLIAEPFGQHWSPIWSVFSVLNVRVAGVQSDLLVRSVLLLLAFLALVAFARTARLFSLSAIAIGAGMATLGLHHLNAVTYYSFDCYSQMASDLIAWTVLSLAIRAAGEPDRGRARRELSAAVALFACGLLIKETALTVIAGLGAIALWQRVRAPRDPASARDHWIASAAALILAAGFALARRALGLSMDADGPYAFCVSCAPANIGMIVGATILPTSTMDVYLAVRDGRVLSIPMVLTGAAAAGVTAVVVSGLVSWARNHGAWDRVGLVAALMLSSTLPIALLAHVGVLHAHTTLFWFALLVAQAVDGWRRRLGAIDPPGRETRVGHALVTAVAAAYVLCLFVGVRSGLEEMRRTGNRARDLIAQFDQALADVPSGAFVIVRGLDTAKAPGDYSLYRLTTSGMLLQGTLGLSLSIRPDLVIEELDGDVASQVASSTPDLASRAIFVVDIRRTLHVTRWRDRE